MMRVESVDKLVSLKRDPKSVALGLDRLWRQSYVKCKSLNEENYENDPISMFPNVASYSPTQWFFQISGYKPWGALFKMHATNTKGKLTTLQCGLNPDKELFPS
jgi:hypothetical protein